MLPSIISSRIVSDSRRSKIRHARPLARSGGPASAASGLVVAMSAIWRARSLCGAGEVEASPDLGGQLGQRRRQQVGEGARSWRRIVEYVNDTAWPRRHHGDAVREEYCLADRMGDEHHGFAAVHPDAL